MYPECIPIKCTAHMGAITDISFSKAWDSGYYLASASLDENPILHHGDTGDWVASFEGHLAPVWSVALNRDGTLLLTGSMDRTARLWNPLLGNQLQEYEQVCAVRSVALDTDSTMLAAGFMDEQGLIVCSLEHKSKPTLYPGHAHGVREVLFCRDNRSLLTSSHDRSIRLWDRLTGLQANSIILPHHAKSMELNSDKETLTVAYGCNVLFINLNTFTVISQRKMNFKVMCASLHPAKETFVCVSFNNYIYKCDYATGNILMCTKAQKASIRNIKYSPDGEVYATSADDGSLYLWPQTVGKKYGRWT